MMALLVVIGYATILAVIIIAVIEARRMDHNKGSRGSKPPEDKSPHQ